MIGLFPRLVNGKALTMLVSLVAVFILLTGLPGGKALADGSQWPTPTPTPLPPTITPLPPPPTPIPATATATPLPPYPAYPVYPPAQQLLVINTPIEPTATSVTKSGFGFNTTLVCWSFAIAVVLVAIIGATFWIKRRGL
jgi:hypothetical protein